jgi:integrase
MIDALLSVGHWLMQEEKLPTRLMAPKNWRRILKDEWRRITNVTPSLRQPRYEEAEWTRLQAALDDPRLDPRMRLAFTLGAHARLGQVIRCHRVDLDLPALTGDETDDSFFGELRVPGDGKKRGTRIRLSPAERRAVDTAMAGYLRDYERARIAGHRSNYPLFPAGRLRAGRAKQADDTQPITRDGARGLFVALEQIAGVTHVPGRGWYGARRFAADIAEDYEQDERALNQLTGHSDSTMRRHYQNLKRDETARKAAKVRDQLRGHGVVAVHNASGDADGT